MIGGLNYYLDGNNSRSLSFANLQEFKEDFLFVLHTLESLFTFFDLFHERHHKMYTFCNFLHEVNSKFHVNRHCGCKALCFVLFHITQGVTVKINEFERPQG